MHSQNIILLSSLHIAITIYRESFTNISYLDSTIRYKHNNTQTELPFKTQDTHNRRRVRAKHQLNIHVIKTGYIYGL